MNKPLPWNVKGVGFDAREAARIAAKRAGIPLGEWLNEIIAARAAELGVQVDDVDADDRLEAIAARLSDDGAAARAQNGSVTLPTNGTARQEAVQSAQRMAGVGSMGEEPLGPKAGPGALPANTPSSQVRAGRDLGSQTTSAARDLPRDALANEVDVVSAARRSVGPNDEIGNAEPNVPARQEAGGEGGSTSARRSAQMEATDLDARLALILNKLNRSFEDAQDFSRTVATSASASVGPKQPAIPPVAAAVPNAGEARENATTVAPRQTPPAAHGAVAKPQQDTSATPEDIRAALKVLADKLDSQPARMTAAVPKPPVDRDPVAAAPPRRIETPFAERERVRETQKLRDDIAQLSASLTDLAPRHALASLEAAMRELAVRVDLSKLDGVQASLLAPIERLGNDVRDAIRSADIAPELEALRHEMGQLNARVRDASERPLDPQAFARIHSDLGEVREAVHALVDRIGMAERMQAEVVALSDKVGTLAERMSPLVFRELGIAIGDIRILLQDFGAAGKLGIIDQKIDTIAARLAAMSDAREPAAFFDNLTQQIDRAHESIVARLSPFDSTASELSALHNKMGSLSAKIDAIGNPSQDLGTLHSLVSDLAERLDDARHPQAQADALNALQARIGTLVERLDQTGPSDSALHGLERLIGDLFLQIEQSRNVAIDAAENAARAAAQDTLRAAMDNPALNGAELTVQTGLDVDHVSQELAELRRIQEASDRRVNATLSALNTTLERLVDRLVSDQAASAPVRSEARTEPQARRRSRTAPERGVGHGDDADNQPAFDPDQFLLEPGSAASLSKAPGTGDAPVPQVDRSGAATTEVAPLIAAARRAAQAAQASALDASVKAGTASATAPAGKTRSFFAAKQRSMLLGLAGLVLLAGTLQIVRLSKEPAPDATPAASESGNEDAAATSDHKTAAPPAKPEAPAAVQDAPKPPSGGASLLTPPVAADKAATAFIPAVKPPAPVASVSDTTAQPSADAALSGLNPGLKDLALGGNAAAQFEVGVRFADGRGVTRDAKQALTWFQRAAQQGLAPAQYRLGSVYEKGVGVPVDASLAIAWYEKAASQGNVRAMHNLAVMSAEGAGGKPDYGKAVTWFTKAASYGVRDSQFNLAVLFARGLGVPQDLGQSYAWFALAAAQGDTDASTKRDAVATKLDAKALSDAKATVASFHPLTPEGTVNDVSPPPGGWEAAAPAKSAGRKTEARVSSM